MQLPGASKVSVPLYLKTPNETPQTAGVNEDFSPGGSFHRPQLAGPLPALGGGPLAALLSASAGERGGLELGGERLSAGVRMG